MRYTKEQLSHLYLKENLSSNQISKLLGIPKATISWALRKFNIPRRSTSEARNGKHYSPDTQFKKGGHYCPEMEFKKGCIHPWLSWNFGLTKETDQRVKQQAERVSKTLKGTTHRNAKYRFTRQFYEKLYYQDTLSLDAIASLLGCDMKTVHYYLKRYGIQRRNRFKAMRIKPSGPERRFIEITERHNLPFVYVGDGKLIIDRRCPDFVNTNGRKQLIEIFGEYWHQQVEEKERKEHFAKYGFETLIIWENELADEATVVKKVQEKVQAGVV